MPIIDKIKEIEAEMARTQKNKATEGHLGMLKAKLAKLRTQQLEGSKTGGGKGEGWEVEKTGDARVALIGFPSVGKSSLLNALTNTKSEAAAYEFTTLTCIPGNVFYRGTKIQLLDLPGIIEGAAAGKGRGRQVVAVAKSADLILIVLDAGREGVNRHREILEGELNAVGIRLNQRPPNITLNQKRDGGIKFNTTVPLSHFGDEPERVVYRILHEYKVHNADVLFREDITLDQFIDVIEGNRRYIKCMYLYNKVDTITVSQMDALARQEHALVASVHLKLNLDRLLDSLWDYLAIRRVYTKKKGQAPDFGDPVVLAAGRHGFTVEGFCRHIHTSMITDFRAALVWGTSAIHQPQTCGLQHPLEDEDVVQVLTKTNAQQKSDKDYAARVQAHWDKLKAKKKAKAKLKT